MRPATVTRLHVVTDGVLVALAWLGGYLTRWQMDPVFARPLNAIRDYLVSVPMVVFPWLFSGWFFGVYQWQRNRPALDAIRNLLRAALLGFLAVSAIGFFFKEYDFGRAVVLLASGYAVVLLGVSRTLYGSLHYRVDMRHVVNTLVVGAGTTGIRVLQKLQDDPDRHYRVVGFLDDDPRLDQAKVASLPVLGTSTEIRRIVREQQIGEVIIAIPSLPQAKLLSIVIACDDHQLSFRVVTNIFEVLTGDGGATRVGDLPLVPLFGSHRASIFYAPAKRLIDILGATALLLLSAPLWAWWALRIKLDSKGPVLFRQARVGKNGKPFTLYKLRTMRADVEPYAVAPDGEADSRITRYGAWLRRSSIDELPNLINVLLGQMSLVGPRPEMPFIVDTYDDWQRLRLMVKPGITGLWQILGRKDLPMHDNLQYDFYYIYNRSALLDLTILLKTVVVVLKQRGAY